MIEAWFGEYGPGPMNNSQMAVRGDVMSSTIHLLPRTGLQHLVLVLHQPNSKQQQQNLCMRTEDSHPADMRLYTFRPETIT